MIRQLIRRFRRAYLPERAPMGTGLFFGPFPARMPDDWGDVVTHPAYRAAHARLADIIERERGWRPEIGARHPPSPGIATFEFGFGSETLHQLAQLAVVHAEGIRYDFVAAVSLGEFAAAAAAGVMSPEDVVSILLASLRGILTTNDGDLVLLPLGSRMPESLAGRPPELVMRGLQSEVRAARRETLATIAEVPGARILGRDVMPHTAAVDIDALVAALAPLAARRPVIPYYSSSAGGAVHGIVDASYWTRLVRERARLDELLMSLAGLGPVDLIGIASITLDSELATAGVTGRGHFRSLSARLSSRADAEVRPPRFDPNDANVRRDVHVAYERCRHAELVVSGDREVVAIGHHAVLEVLRRSDDFSSAPNSTFPVLHGADAPDHPRRRRALAAHFSAARQAERAPSMRAHTAAAVAQIRGRKSFALVADFAHPIPFRDTCEWLGIAELRANELLTLAPTSMRWSDVAPRLGAAGLLHDLRAEGELSDDEIAQLAPFLLTAGLTTVTDFVVNAVCALYERPALLARVRGNAALLGPIVDELLRLEPPVHALPRVALRDTSVAGQAIAAGTMVQCSYAAANRDPAAHDAPNALIPERDGPRSLTFGHGPHYCLGAATGRAFSEILLGALLHDLSGYEPAEDVHDLLARATPAFSIRRRVTEIAFRRMRA